MKRDNRISVISESGSGYGNLKAVMIYGKAKIIYCDTKLVRVVKVIEKISLKYSNGLVSEDYLDSMKHLAVKRSAVIIRPTKYISWDHNKI